MELQVMKWKMQKLRESNESVAGVDAIVIHKYIYFIQPQVGNNVFDNNIDDFPDVLMELFIENILDNASE